MNGPWYQNPATMAEIMSNTTMTETEYWNFYNPNTTMSFGQIMGIELTQISQWY